MFVSDLKWIVPINKQPAKLPIIYENNLYQTKTENNCYSFTSYRIEKIYFLQLKT
jgi:hypothetical protein